MKKISSLRYITIFTLLASIFLPVCWFLLLTMMIAPVSGLFSVLGFKSLLLFIQLLFVCEFILYRFYNLRIIARKYKTPLSRIIFISSLIIFLLPALIWNDYWFLLFVTIHVSLYLLLYRFLSVWIYKVSRTIQNNRISNLVLIAPLLLILSSSFLPIVHYNGWGGRSFDYTFWEACGRIIEKLSVALTLWI